MNSWHKYLYFEIPYKKQFESEEKNAHEKALRRYFELFMPEELVKRDKQKGKNTSKEQAYSCLKTGQVKKENQSICKGTSNMHHEQYSQKTKRFTPACESEIQRKIALDVVRTESATVKSHCCSNPRNKRQEISRRVEEKRISNQSIKTQITEPSRALSSKQWAVNYTTSPKKVNGENCACRKSIRKTKEQFERTTEKTPTIGFRHDYPQKLQCFPYQKPTRGQDYQQLGSPERILDEPQYFLKDFEFEPNSIPTQARPSKIDDAVILKCKYPSSGSIPCENYSSESIKTKNKHAISKNKHASQKFSQRLVSISQNAVDESRAQNSSKLYRENRKVDISCNNQLRFDRKDLQRTFAGEDDPDFNNRRKVRFAAAVITRHKKGHTETE